MRRALRFVLTLSLFVTGCSTPAGNASELRVQGTVDDALVVVTVPYLASPAVDLSAGFASTAEAPAGAPAAGIASFARVAAVSAREGDVVDAGQPLLQLDDRLLRAQVRVAEADAKTATLRLDVLEDRIEDTREAEREIADKRAEVTDAIAELTSNRKKVKDAIAALTSTRAELKQRQAKAEKARSDLKAQRTEAGQARTGLIEKRRQAQAALDALPPEGTPLPPGTPTREELEATIAHLTAGIAQLDTALAKLAVGLRQVEAGLAKLADGLKQIDTGLTEARKGLKKIEDGLAKARDGLHELDDAKQEVLDARAELIRLRRLAERAADAASVPLALARTQLDQASLSSPVAGTVVSVAAVGDLRAPGAGLATVRRGSGATATTWLSPTQASTVCAGDRATVSGDWMADGGSAAATVDWVATSAEFPPTSFATDEVHLIRAFRVQLSSPAALPAGMPVTISIQPCNPAPAGTGR